MSPTRPASVVALSLAPKSLVVITVAVMTAGCSAASDLSVSAEEAAPSAAARESLTPRIDELLKSGKLTREKWRLNLGERYGRATAIAHVESVGDVIIVQDDRHEVHGLDAVTGVHRFVVQLSGELTQAVGAAQNALSFVCTDEVVAVDRNNGARIMPRPSNHLAFFPSARAAVVDSSGFIGRLAPFGVQALDLAGNFEGWFYATSSPVLDLVVVGEGLLTVVGATEDGLLFGLPPRGATDSQWAPEESWFRRLAGTRVVTPLALSGHEIFFGAQNGSLYRVDARSGTVLWKVQLGDVDLRGNDAVVAGGTVYQGARTTDGDSETWALHAFDVATGAWKWKCDGGRRLITRVGERCYIDLGDGNVSLRKADSGAEIGAISLAGLGFVPTIQGGGVLICGDASGNLFALE